MVMQSLHFFVDCLSPSMISFLLVQYQSFSHIAWNIKSKQYCWATIVLHSLLMLLGLSSSTHSSSFPEGRILNISGPNILIHVAKSLKGTVDILGYLVSPFIPIATSQLLHRICQQQISQSQGSSAFRAQASINVLILSCMSFHLDIELPTCF